MGDLSRDGSVGSLDWKGEDADEEIQSGSIYLFKWLADTWADGGGKHVVIQVGATPLVHLLLYRKPYSTAGPAW